ncbi:MAG: hypothetical protein ACR2N6_04855 [Miltoncostaeaceae bacterium]
MAVNAGLCDRCAHQQVVATRRARYSLCRLHADDPSFRKYPPTPVLRCRGFVDRRDAPSSERPGAGAPE